MSQSTGTNTCPLPLSGRTLLLSIEALIAGRWTRLPLQRRDSRCAGERDGVRAELTLTPTEDPHAVDYRLLLRADQPTRLRLRIQLPDAANPFHLIPGNIHGDNNAPHVAPGQFPCLSTIRPDDPACAPLWELRADRASHPVSMLCDDTAVAAICIDPYSDSDEAEDGFIRNGVFAALPDAFGVSLGYGNDPLTFVEKTKFQPPTMHTTRSASAGGRIWMRPGGREGVHEIIRWIYSQRRECPRYERTYTEALAALADAFISISYQPQIGQYTNLKCHVPEDPQLRPWRAIVEIGWTGGSMMAYPFALAERLLPGICFPLGSAELFNRICSGYSIESGLIRDTVLNRYLIHRPAGWNESDINGWWSGFLPKTRDAHCAYTNAHAAYYLLRTAWLDRHNRQPQHEHWIRTALRVLDTAIALQREDGAFGYLFSSTRREVIDWDGFAGCWFAAALPYAWQITGEARYRRSAERAMEFYHQFVRALACWGTPMDTYKSIDSEGNLAFIRAARLLHERTGDDRYLEMLRDGAMYEYLWRYGFRARPEFPPLKGSHWNSCGGSLTSVSNPHIHPMSVVATADLEYLARQTRDNYHRQRAEDGMAWLMHTMELYPDVVGYGRYGVLSERTCPSDGLVVERYSDGTPASTWWSYNAWAAASAMEAIGERLAFGDGEEQDLTVGCRAMEART